jgi:hypothetical protein
MVGYTFAVFSPAPGHPKAYGTSRSSGPNAKSSVVAHARYARTWRRSRASARQPNHLGRERRGREAALSPRRRRRGERGGGSASRIWGGRGLPAPDPAGAGALRHTAMAVAAARRRARCLVVVRHVQGSTPVGGREWRAEHELSSTRLPSPPLSCVVGNRPAAGRSRPCPSAADRERRGARRRSRGGCSRQWCRGNGVGGGERMEMEGVNKWQCMTCGSHTWLLVWSMRYRG